MIHLEIETSSGKLVIQQVVSYIDSEDCFMLLRFDKDNLVGKPVPVSYTHLTLPTTPYV